MMSKGPTLTFLALLYLSFATINTFGLDGEDADDIIDRSNRNPNSKAKRTNVDYVCCGLLEKHPKMVPGSTWGSMSSSQERNEWTKHNCDDVVGGSSMTNCRKFSAHIECRLAIQWAHEKGKTHKKANEWYGKMEDVSGLTIQDATFEDFQRLFKCENIQNCKKGIQFPSKCSVPPCDRCQAEGYEKTSVGSLCSEEQYEIKSAGECKEAADSLGLQYHSAWRGHNDFPACLYADDGRSKVYFNLTPGKRTNLNPRYSAICKSKDLLSFVGRCNDETGHATMLKGWIDSDSVSHCHQACRKESSCTAFDFNRWKIGNKNCDLLDYGPYIKGSGSGNYKCYVMPDKGHWISIENRQPLGVFWYGGKAHRCSTGLCSNGSQWQCQCYWSDLQVAKDECRAWPACKTLYQSDKHLPATPGNPVFWARSDRKMKYEQGAVLWKWRVCYDTYPWVNGHGHDCSSYAKRWCRNGGAKPGSEWTLGSKYNYPENNCCVCGKGHR